VPEYPARPKVSLLTDGGFILALQTRRGTGAMREDLWVSRWTATGEVRWQKTFQNELLMVASQMRGDKQGVWISGLEHQNVKHGADGVLYRINLQGELEWACRYGFDGGDELRHILPGAGGNVRVVMNSLLNNSRLLGSIDRHGQWSNTRVLNAPGTWANVTGVVADPGLLITGTYRLADDGDHDAWVANLSEADVDSLPTHPGPTSTALIDLQLVETDMLIGNAEFTSSSVVLRAGPTDTPVIK
jgi:hypothetical protein